MKRTFLIIFALIFAGTVGVNAQIGNVIRKAKETANDVKSVKPGDTKKTSSSTTNGGGTETRSSSAGSNDRYKDSEFLLVGGNELDGKAISGMKACTHGATSRRMHPPMSEVFIAWSTSIEETAAIRSLQSGTCHVIAYFIDKHPDYKYNSIDSLTEIAQGNSIYKVEGEKLMLIRKIEAPKYFVVIVPQQNKPGLKLADLRICGSPQTIDLYKRRVVAGSYCHDQQQKLYVFEKYKNYPGPLAVSSVLFDEAEYSQLNKQGKLKGLIVYRLEGGELVPAP